MVLSQDPDSMLDVGLELSDPNNNYAQAPDVIINPTTFQIAIRVVQSLEVSTSSSVHPSQGIPHALCSVRLVSGRVVEFVSIPIRPFKENQ